MQMDPHMVGMDPNIDPNTGMPIQYGQQEQQQKNYFESIETDEYNMPNKWEVEIRMQDN